MLGPGEEVVDVGRTHPLHELDARADAKDKELPEGRVRGVGGGVRAAARLRRHAVPAGGDGAPEEVVVVRVAVDRELSPDLKLQDRVDEVVVGRVAHVPALVAHADLSVADLAHRSGDARPSARINARGTRTIVVPSGAGLGDEPAVCVLFKVKAFVSLRPAGPGLLPRPAGAAHGLPFHEAKPFALRAGAGTT